MVLVVSDISIRGRRLSFLLLSVYSLWHRTVRRPRGLMAREKKSSLGGAAHSFAAVQVHMCCGD